MSRLYDTQNLRNILTREFDNLIIKYPEPEALQNDIINIQKKLLSELEITQEIILIPQLTIQRVHHLLAAYVLVQDERKAWYLHETIKTLIVNPEIERLIKDKYKNNYPVLLSRLRRSEKIIDETKFLLDHLENKTINNNDTKNWGYNRLLTILQELPLITPELHQIMNIILTNTNIGNQKIPNQILLTQERQYKKVNLQETEQQNNPKTTTEENTKRGE
jgi:hypothetical protein